MIRLKSCPITLSIKVAESDKEKMLKAAQEFNISIKSKSDDLASANVEEGSGEHTPAQTTEEWITFDKPMIYLL